MEQQTFLSPPGLCVGITVIREQGRTRPDLQKFNSQLLVRLLIAVTNILGKICEIFSRLQQQKSYLGQQNAVAK
jgi:hypothetical protein